MGLTEVAPTKIAAQQAHEQPGQGQAQAHTEPATERTHQAALHPDQSPQPCHRCTQHTEQGQLRPLPDHGEVHRGGHQEAPREQGHHGEHGEVHAVSPREIRHASVSVLGGHHRKRLTDSAQLVTKTFYRLFACKLDVDARDQTQPTKGPLGRANVHDREGLSRHTRKVPSHAQPYVL